MDHEYLNGVAEFQKLAVEKGHECLIARTNDCALVGVARCHLAREAMQAKADVSLWVDSDILFDAETALRMCGECGEDHEIVGAPCSTKRPLGVFCTEWLEHQRRVDFWEAGGLYEIQAIGMGCTAVHSSCFDRLSKTEQCSEVTSSLDTPIHPFFQQLFVPYNGKILWSGEDYGFCILARDAGMHVFTDTRVRTFHKGNYGYKVEDIGASVPAIRTLAFNVRELTFCRS
jgi:hypothetical protein